MIKPKLRCPLCGHRLSRIIDSRGEGPRLIKDQLAWTGGEGPWRRRECCECGATFTTEEIIRGPAHRPSELKPPNI